MKATIIIVGGGLAGLYAARLLHAAGADFLLFEARDRLGGRILSADAAGHPATDGFDLGPSWFWPEMQPGVAALVGELGLAAFAQNSDGEMLFEHMSGEAPQRFPGFAQAPQSMRLAGGTQALVRALEAGLPAERLRRGMAVTKVRLEDNRMALTVMAENASALQAKAEQVIFALPPRLLEATVSFSPVIEPAMTVQWRATATWMAPHAKFFALYDRPFWREAGLSGMARSKVGPLGEIHDATSASGAPALFGFVGISAAQRFALGKEAVLRACVAQLGCLFGAQALRPRATLYKDWSVDPLTATQQDRVAVEHPAPEHRPWVSGIWQNRIWLAGSETSPNDPGYLAGAVDAAQRAVAEIVETSRSHSAKEMTPC